MFKRIKHFIPHNIYSKEFFLYFFLVFLIAFFLIYAYLNHNLEFVFYSVILFAVLNFGIYVHKYSQLPEFIVVGITILAIMHIMGGNVRVNNLRLYDTFFLGGLIRYDNIVHVIGSILATLVLNNLFFHYALEKTKIVITLYYFSLFLMAMGVGILNELIEFIAVVFFNAQQGVGDYLNNATDLVFNAIGVLMAILMIDLYYRYTEKRENFWQKMRDKFQKIH